MYNKISFKENSDYFSHSSIFLDLKQHLAIDNDTLCNKYYLDMIENPQENINLVIQLYMENIIKHNLSSSMIGGTLNPVRFLSEDNSQEVFDKFNYLVNPKRRALNAPKPTNEELELERAHSNLQLDVVDAINYYIYKQRDVQNIDICETMKEEFGTFLNNKNHSNNINNSIAKIRSEAFKSSTNNQANLNPNK